jgi:site-specific DNA-methyltransferase (adenine-specific)
VPACKCKGCGKPFEAPPAHRLLCGDSRKPEDVARLFAGAKANVAITSPPYASQRKYDESSGFKPIPPDEYVEWFKDVAAGIESVLAADGSYFLNIKEHAHKGQRSLYVKDLTIAHVRQWAWLFVDEFCWRKTDNGVPGSWPNRFKNAFEPVFHFARTAAIKFRPEGVTHHSDLVMQPGSGQGHHAGGHRMDGSVTVYTGANAVRTAGLARPGNVIEVRSETGQGDHSAPFPRALVEFFLKAFSDAGDVVFDPFMGSGTTMAAAHVLRRTGYGCEISPGYCDVVVRRLAALGAGPVRLEATGQTFEEVAAARGVKVAA